MIREFLQKAVLRHMQETELFFKKLHEYENVSLKEMMNSDQIKPDSLLFKIPIERARPLGEVLLHMIRSLEFYIVGIVENRWEPLQYNLLEFNTIPEIVLLFENVSNKIIRYMKKISSNILDEEIGGFNRPATKAELLLEMLEHSIHHRGQLSVYFRLLDIEPPIIDYII